MTYNEWRDELKTNLLCVSDAERRRVLDYYAEAYADRRDAGFTEREIIEDFGAPYDAAQRILAENREEYNNYSSAERNPRPRDTRPYDGDRESRDPRGDDRAYEREVRRTEREQRREEKRVAHEQRRAERERRCNDYRNAERTRGNDCYDGGYYNDDRRYSDNQMPPPEYGNGGSVVFVLLCIIFCVPIFCIIMGMVSITVALCAAPFGMLISGVATIGSGIGEMFTSAAAGAVTVGTGIIVFGLSLIIMPLCFKLVGLMWKLFKNFFRWLKNLLCGRRAY